VRVSPAGGRQHDFVDTSFWFVLADRRDERHRKSADLVQGVSAQGRTLVTTNFVLAETHALILRRLGRSQATEFLGQLDRGAATLLRVSEEDERRAQSIIHTYADKDVS